MGEVQHLLDAGSRRGRRRRTGTRRRPFRSSRGRASRSRSTGGAPSRRSTWPDGEGPNMCSTTAATPRCSCTRASSSSGGRGARSLDCRERRDGHPRDAQPPPRGAAEAVARAAAAIKGVTEETTTGVHRLYQMHGRNAAVPGDQRQRLGDEVEVRQPLRLPSLADRRHQPRHRRDDRRQGRVVSATATSARAAPIVRGQGDA